MKKVIYKYQFPDLHFEPGICKLNLPWGSEFRKAGVQGGIITLWYLIDLDEEKEEEKEFLVLGTGMPLPVDINLEPVDTVFQDPYVWHIFEIK